MVSFVGESNQKYESILFVAFAVIAGILGTLQLVFLQKLMIVPVLLLPFLSFCICFENSVLSQGNNVTPTSPLAQAAYVFHSFQIPLFVITLYEISFRLHEARSAHFCCIPFDQGPDITNIPGTTSLWVVRLIAAGLFVMNIFVDFSLAKVPHSPDTGRGGYASLANDPTSKSLWLALIPPIFLSIIGIVIGIIVYK